MKLFGGFGGFAGQAAATPVARALFMGGYTGAASSDVIDYVQVDTTGNATDFGDLSSAVNANTACASTTRGVSAGGSFAISLIEYVTIATTGNAVTFGNLTQGRRSMGGLASATRGVFGGGQDSGTGTPPESTIDYITIASTGNATDFGDVTLIRDSLMACSSPTRGVFAGGLNSEGGNTYYNRIDYITIASTGNATDFGDLTVARAATHSGAASETRGVFAGGNISDGASTNIIDYITIATTGNATDFGDLTIINRSLAGASSNVRALFAGGRDSSSVYQNRIDYITIATTGNATDFGDLTVARTTSAGCSSGHGGLQ